MEQTPIERLEQYISEGLLIRGAWVGRTDDGRDTACLLAALSPACGTGSNPECCPTDLMPAWLAHLTPWIDDAGSDHRWMEHVFRYADLAARWHVLDQETWRRLDYKVRAICVRAVLPYATTKAARTACKAVIALCDRVSRGGSVSRETWTKAQGAAADAAARAAADAAASAATWAAADAAASAATWAADAAYAADKIIDAILDCLEDAIRAKDCTQ